MTPIILIPARMAATRLPGKPLADIGGQTMIGRVLRQALAADIGPVVVAAGDPEVAEAVRAAGGRAVLTAPGLPSGSDRIQSALGQIDPEGRHDVVVNLQGDMPFVDPACLAACVDTLGETTDCDIATLIAPEAGPADRTNPDVVKAVVALTPGQTSGKALWFTRSTLFGEGPVWRHVGLYAYRRAALARFNAAPPSPLELRERLEQLRALELGMTIRASVTRAAPISVDTPADLEAARAHAREMAA